MCRIAAVPEKSIVLLLLGLGVIAYIAMPSAAPRAMHLYSGADIVRYAPPLGTAAYRACSVLRSPILPSGALLCV